MTKEWISTGIFRRQRIDRKNEADQVISGLQLCTYVGEWSLGLDPRAFSCFTDGILNYPADTTGEFRESVAYRAYGAAQLAAFEKYLGWFFWSYRTERDPTWSFRECVARGWLPNRYDG